MPKKVFQCGKDICGLEELRVDCGTVRAAVVSEDEGKFEQDTYKNRDGLWSMENS